MPLLSNLIQPITGITNVLLGNIYDKSLVLWNNLLGNDVLLDNIVQDTGELLDDTIDLLSSTSSTFTSISDQINGGTSPTVALLDLNGLVTSLDAAVPDLAALNSEAVDQLVGLITQLSLDLTAVVGAAGTLTDEEALEFLSIMGEGTNLLNGSLTDGFIEGLVTDISDSLAGILGNSSILPDASGVLGVEVTDAIEGVLNNLNTVTQDLPNSLQGDPNTLSTTLQSLVTEVQGLVDTLAGLTDNSTIAALSTTLSGLSDRLLAVVEDLDDGTVPSLTELVNAIAPVADDLLGITSALDNLELPVNPFIPNETAINSLIDTLGELGFTDLTTELTGSLTELQALQDALTNGTQDPGQDFQAIADVLNQIVDNFDPIVTALQTEGSPSALELANLLQELSTSLTATVDDLVDGNPPVAEDLLDQLLQPTDDLGDLTETLNTNHRIGTDGDDSFETTFRRDVFEMGAGNDTVTATFSDLHQSDSLDGATGIDRFVVTGGSSSDSLILRSSSEASRHNLVPSPNMEGTVVQNFEQFDLSGFLGQTTFTGGLEDNLVIGGAGNDVLNGGGGSDGLDGGDGNDRLVGGAGDDVLNGGLGNDRLVGGTDNDVLDGGAGDDILSGVRGNNRLIGAAGNDFLKGGAENDVLLGGADNDRLVGGRGNDILNGGAGNDRLVSGPGNSRLLGGQGNDILIGGTGRNALSGGGGRDRFVFEKAQGTADVVTDFNARQDQIVIARRGFGAVGLSAGRLPDRQFVLGSRAQSADERFIYDDRSGTLFFDPDGNGSQKQRAIAVLGGQPSLSARQIVIA